MNVSLYQVFGATRASNPNARNRQREPLISKRFGNRAFRRRVASLVRKHGVDAVMKGVGA